MLEMTICVIFLLLVVVALFEFAMVAYTRIALLNAAREGANYASIWPDVVNGPSSPHYAEFLSTTWAEAQAAGLVTTSPTFEILPLTRTSPPNCENNVCTVTCTLRYEVMNDTQGIFLPMMGRLGLFQTLTLQVEAPWPIRDEG